MAARLTDKKRKMIMADRAEGLSIRQLARKYKVSTATVQRVINGNTELAQLVTQKKEQNTLDMLEYMDSRKVEAQGIIDDYLRALADPNKIASAKLNEVATALGIVVDKFTKTTPTNENALNKLDEVLKEIGGVV